MGVMSFSDDDSSVDISLTEVMHILSVIDSNTHIYIYTYMLLRND